MSLFDQYYKSAKRQGAPEITFHGRPALVISKNKGGRWLMRKGAQTLIFQDKDNDIWESPSKAEAIAEWIENVSDISFDITLSDL